MEKASCRPPLNPLNDLGLILPRTLPWETNARQALGQLLEHFEVPELFYAWAEQRSHVFGVQMSAHWVRGGTRVVCARWLSGSVARWLSSSVAWWVNIQQFS